MIVHPGHALRSDFELRREGCGGRPDDPREAALAAIVAAADGLGVEPVALSRPAYRAVCRDGAHDDLPTAVAISALFGGWQRAREQIAIQRLCGERPVPVARDERR